MVSHISFSLCWTLFLYYMFFERIGYLKKNQIKLFTFFVLRKCLCKMVPRSQWVIHVLQSQMVPRSQWVIYVLQSQIYKLYITHQICVNNLVLYIHWNWLNYIVIVWIFVSNRSPKSTIFCVVSLCSMHVAVNLRVLLGNLHHNL